MDVGRTSLLSGREQLSTDGVPDRHTLVVFDLDGREFALPIEDIAEILQMVLVTPVPEVPPWVAGVVNLRGRVIPILDLRTRLGFETKPPQLNTPILVAEQDTRKLGLIADAVVDVISLDDAALEPPAELGASDGHEDAVAAVAQTGDRLIMVLDLARVTADAASLAEARPAPDASRTSDASPNRDVD
jgi:purine-binding chemotaxis protein CheW